MKKIGCAEQQHIRKLKLISLVTVT